MFRLAALLLLSFVISCASTGNIYKQKGDFDQYQIHEIDVLKRMVYNQPDIEGLMRSTPSALQPQEWDFLTASADLNGDGKPDIIGAVNHYKFMNKDGAYPIYIMPATEHDYTVQEEPPYVMSFDITILDSVTNGYRDIRAGKRVLKYNGTTYR